MMLRNNVSRYHVIETAISGAAKHNPQVALDMTSLLGDVKHQVSKVLEYISWLLDRILMELSIFPSLRVLSLSVVGRVARVVKEKMGSS